MYSQMTKSDVPTMSSEFQDQKEPENVFQTTPHLHEYARLIGIDPKTEPDLLWIADEGLRQPLDDDWKIVELTDGDYYFVNRKTGKPSWEHPQDDIYRQKVIEMRQKTDSQKEEKNTENPSVDNKFPEILSDDSVDYQQEYSSDDGTFGSEMVENDEIEEFDEISDRRKSVTFSDNLVETIDISEEPPEHRHGLFQQQITKIIHEEDLTSSGVDTSLSISAPLEGNVEDDQAQERDPVESFEQKTIPARLLDIRESVNSVVARNWRNIRTTLAHSYAKSHEIASEFASRYPVVFEMN